MRLILNIIWFVLAGWYIAVAHVVIGAAQFVTLIGIPFGIWAAKSPRAARVINTVCDTLQTFIAPPQ